MRVCLLVIILLFHTLAAADVVVFRNDDRLSGRVVHKDDTKLVFETAHAGTVNIEWRNIKSLATDKPLTIMLRSGDIITAEAMIADEGGNALPNDSRRNVALKDIAYINPTPEQSGVGVAYSGRASLAASDTRGNTTGRRIYTDAEFAARARDYRYNLRAKIDRQRESGQQTASNWRTDGNYDWFLDQKTFRYVRGSFEHDRFKDIELRSSIGGGYGLQFIETTRTNISLRGGLDYVTVDHINAVSEDYPALGWGLRAKHRLETHRIELFHEQDGFLRLTKSNEITVRSRTGVRVPIAGGMNASLQLNLDWEQKPAPGRKSTDSVLLLGLGYEW